MTKYSQTAKAFLQRNNPQELVRLEKEGKMAQFVEDLDELFEDQEQTIIDQMTKNLPDKYLERVRSQNMSRMVARDWIFDISHNYF